MHRKKNSSGNNFKAKSSEGAFAAIARQDA